jgi:predicted short-subunit dehydrogenase-like oxidoreductase (DUF2520 family)
MLPRIWVVGVGRVGGALATQYKHAGGSVEVVARSRRAKSAARRLGLRVATKDRSAGVVLCFLAVPDSEVSLAAQAVAPLLPTSTALVHCAGALRLSDLGSSAAITIHPRASFHPLAAVSHPSDELRGKAVAISATSPAVRRHLLRVAKALGMAPLFVSESRRALYHASAVLAAGGVVALLGVASDGLVRAGVPRRDSLLALVGLARSALCGLEKRGLRGAMTGPVARGDTATLKKNLDALNGQDRSLYHLLMLRALVGSALRGHQRAAVKAILSGL